MRSLQRIPPQTSIPGYFQSTREKVIYLRTDDIISLAKNALDSEFAVKLDNFSIKQLEIIGDSCSWIVLKVLPLHTIDKKEVDRYFRLYVRPDISCSVRYADPLEDMSSDQLAALVALQSFAIDVAEEDYVSFFGDYEERDFENE